ncbi:MAG: PAS domain-containing sensor histidine kinase [Clostridia bacterium]|nr:PAS domain-containing sensor histidine kinase [Clostridia bacterium]
MTRRIFTAVMLTALAVFAASMLLIMGALYDYFTGVQLRQLRAETELAAQGLELLGEEYFRGLETENLRITWIAADGTILYDSAVDLQNMENHIETERKEIAEALRDGSGTSTRFSDTLMKKYSYAAQRMSDGTVLRLSEEHPSVFVLIFGLLQPILLIAGCAAALSMWLAAGTSRKIIADLNVLDLSRPLENEGYEELSPLLHRLEEQQKQLRAQSAELRRRQNEFAAVTDNMKDGLILLDAKGRILSINNSARSLLKPIGSCTGQDILTVNRSTEMQELLRSAQCGLRAEKILEIDGLRYQVDINPVDSTLPDSDYVLTGYVILMFDVTEKEKAEQMRREFTANVSHELKTPLHSISGCAELLSSGLVRPEDEAQFLGQIYTEAQRMIRLVDDIIGLSRLDEGADDSRREPVDLYMLAGRTVNSLQQTARDAEVAFLLTGNPTEICGFPQLISGIIYNLCDNAIKYNRAGGTVKVDVSRREKEAVLTVADTGIGIPPEHQPRIFERFYRVDKSHSKEVGGTGLGLSIVKHAAQIHGAEIGVNSKPGEGTSITVTFPLE